MKDRSLRGIVGLVITVGLVIRLVVATQPLERLIPICLADDAFYYLRIAENVLEGRGATFDGVTATNGYHPLWLLVSMAAVKVGGGAIGGARYLLLLLGLIGSGVAIQLWRLVGREWGPVAGAWTAAFWSLSPMVIFTELMGVEAPLMILFALAALGAYARLRRHDGARLSSWAQLGLWLGLALLSRTDAILFAVVLAVDITLVRLATARHDALAFRRRLQEASVACCSAILIVSPWVFFSIAEHGTVVQDSYRAIMQEQSIGTSIAGRPLLDMFTERAGQGFRQHFVSYFGVLPGVWPLLAMVLLLLAATAARSPGTRAFDSEPSGVMLLLGAWGGLVWGYYVFWFWSAKQWYFLPVHLMIAVGSAGLAARALVNRAGSAAIRWLRRCAVTLVLALLVTGFTVRGLALSRTGYHPWQKVYLKVAEDLKTMHGRHQVRQAGAFNSGVISAFSGMSVVNLDGVVNPEATKAFAERRLLEYIRSRGIDVVADHESVLSFHGEYEAGWAGQFALVKRYGAEQPAGDVVMVRLAPERKR